MNAGATLSKRCSVVKHGVTVSWRAGLCISPRNFALSSFALNLQTRYVEFGIEKIDDCGPDILIASFAWHG